MKINSDGSVAHDYMAAYRGVLRDDAGNFISAYSANVGTCAMLHAKLWGILHGLKLACRLQLHYLIAESDSSLAIQLILNGCSDTHPAAPLIREIKWMLALAQQVRCIHIYREANSIACPLANVGHSLPLGAQYFDRPPSCISFNLIDCSRTSVLRVRM